MLKHTTFRSVKIRYSDLPAGKAGTGKGRAIVLIHGFPESFEIWNTFSESLSKHFRIIAIDLPGFGESESIGYTHPMNLMAECVKEVMDQIGYRKYVVAGHSMGGYVALAFAELFPKNVSGLCLFHSSALPDSEEKKKDRLRAVEIVKQDQKHYVSELINKLFAPDNVPKFEKEIRWLKELGTNTSPQGIINALLGMKDRPDRQDILKKADFPIQFIIGKNDQVMPFQSLMDQSKLNKNTSVTVLEHSGHMGFYEEKERSQKALLKFARRCFR